MKTKDDVEQYVTRRKTYYERMNEDAKNEK